jgi:hypothetical protein
MATRGTATLDFGAFPGSALASVDVTGETEIVAASKLLAFVRLVASADHSADEHRVEQIKVTCGAIVPGAGFTISGECLNAFCYGQFTIDWAWST